MNVLKPDGLLAFHDYQEPCHPDIERVIDGLQFDGFKVLSVHKHLAVVKPPALIPLEV
jgi:hypothetical protein